jgi:nucleoside-diphosphate-sugar epimerase
MRPSVLKNKTVLVTGATGFIGGRLVEKLILEHGAHVRALVKNFARASRIARFKLEMIPGAITNEEAVNEAVNGADVVFHCAQDFASPGSNLSGARLLGEACVRHRVQRLVHVSSISVYEPLPDHPIDETAPSVSCGWTYPDDKRAVEDFLLDFGRAEGLPTVALQPAIVYGPYSRPWTLAPIMKLRNGRLVLPADRDGVCSAVYIDDVVDAMVLAAVKEQALGERFLIAGPDHVSWHSFYDTYERMLGTNSLVFLTTAEIRALNSPTRVGSRLWLLAQDPRRFLQWAPLRNLYERARMRFISERVAMRAKQALPSSLYVPNDVQLALYRSRAPVIIDKARRLLGYSPAFDFRRGMDLTRQYVAWARL